VANNPLVQPDVGLYFWTIFTFLLLLFLLRKFAWTPLLAALERREKTIAGAVEDARKAKEELERVQQDAAQLLVQARREAEGIVSRARSDAERFRDEMQKKASDDAAGIVRNAERRIQQETTKAIEQLRHEAVDLSVAIASKLLRRNVSKEDNERLIREVVSSLDRTSRPN
jgi:F-type H+-transporting ATPase subunit b